MFTKGVVVIGGGPAGLAAALNLGRGCKKVLLCDGGPRRNAVAEEMHGFVSATARRPSNFVASGASSSFHTMSKSATPACTASNAVATVSKSP